MSDYDAGYEAGLEDGYAEADRSAAPDPTALEADPALVEELRHGHPSVAQNWLAADALVMAWADRGAAREAERALRNVIEALCAADEVGDGGALLPNPPAWIAPVRAVLAASLAGGSGTPAAEGGAQCNGMCVMGNEVLPGGGYYGIVAIAHPDCDLHGSPAAPVEHPEGEALSLPFSEPLIERLRDASRKEYDRTHNAYGALLRDAADVIEALQGDLDAANNAYSALAAPVEHSTQGAPDEALPWENDNPADRAAFGSQGARERWAVHLSCCGKEDGVQVCDSWVAANAFREGYCYGSWLIGHADRTLDPHGYSGDQGRGHQRAGIVERAPDGIRLGYWETSEFTALSAPAAPSPGTQGALCGHGLPWAQGQHRGIETGWGLRWFPCDRPPAAPVQGEDHRILDGPAGGSDGTPNPPVADEEAQP